MLTQTPARRLSPGDSSERRDRHSAPERGRRLHRTRAVALAGIVASLVVAGCGSSTAPAPPSLSGAYAFAVNVSETREGLRCDVSGTVEFTQDGELFSGRGDNRVACSGLGSSFTREEMPLIDGQFRGRSVEVEFAILQAPCEARGTASGDPVQMLSGTVRCNFAIDDRIYRLEGRWEAVTSARPAT